MKSNHKLLAFLFGSTLVSGLATLNAQTTTTYTWNGTTDGVFTETLNWTTPPGVAATGGSSASRINVNNIPSANSLSYTSAQGTTTYTGNLRSLVIGSGDGVNGSMFITGGTFDSQGTNGSDIVGHSGGTGSLTVNGTGIYTKLTGNTVFNVGLNGGSGPLSFVSNGTLTIADSGSFSAGTLQFGLDGTTQGSIIGTIVGTVHLNGGVLSVGSIREQQNFNNNSVTSTVNFNGGTLKARANEVNFLGASVTNAVVQGNGAIIDTTTFNVTIAKALTAGSGSGGLTKQGAGTLTLSGANTYTGDTTLTAGTLTLAAGGSQKLIIGVSGTNNKITGNASGTLNLNGKLLLDLTAAGTTLGDSWNVVDVANFVAPPAYGGTLTVDSTLGAFTSSGGNWTKIENGVTYQFSQTSGILSVIPGGANAYDTWAAQITNGLNLRADDADGDGFNNLQEFLYGTSPIAGNGALVSTTTSGGNLVLRWLQRETGATYTLKESTTLDTGSWSTVVSPVPALDGDQTGALTDYDYFTVSIPLGSSKAFFRIEGVEN